jgi:uncharacterized protein YjiS (DUF1127 family)
VSTISVEVARGFSRSVSLRSRLVSRLREWQHRLRSREELAALGSRDLRDIGISRCDAEYEALKPFWRG